MKKTYLTISVALLLLLNACASGKYAANRLDDKNNKVSNVMEEQMSKAESKENESVKEGMSIEEGETAVSEASESSQNPKDLESLESSAQTISSTKETTAPAGDPSVDYDLTVMDSDMVYASVYQLMTDPETYVGKSFKMQGTYYSTFYEPTNKHYHYVIIEDAAACCAQGIEFVWGDGSHVYPDEYPKNESRVEVEGTFETYKEDGDDRLYCRIKNAKMKPVK